MHDILSKVLIEDSINRKNITYNLCHGRSDTVPIGSNIIISIIIQFGLDLNLTPLWLKFEKMPRIITDNHLIATIYLLVHSLMHGNIVSWRAKEFIIL